ncbi:MAG: hypothetical protein EBR01_12070 [Proteobacteria bacterium]|jgi:predicted membrane protein|nr:hypothetical protein [Pseudomonadota bacterium]NBY20248.1 hypothetical protein [bacterium]
MIVFISLFMTVLAGVAVSVLSPSLFNLETSLSSGPLTLWLTIVRAFGVPLSLLLLRFTKNHYVRLASALWGTLLSFLTLVVILKISGVAPSVNFYGVLFVTAVFICSTSTAIFSWIELARVIKEAFDRSEKIKQQKKRESSIEVEGTYQTPTNPS